MPEIDRGNQVLMERVLALSCTMLNHQVDRERPDEMARTLSEAGGKVWRHYGESFKKLSNR
jgi:hypothetical protein